MQCVVLAGGLATRMRPLTEEIPKSLIPIGREPFVHYQLKWLKSTGVTHIVFCIGYKGSMIRDFINDGTRWGLKVSYVDEGENLLGTGGALRLAYDHGALDSSFLVTYGDSFLPIDFSEVWGSFHQLGKPALMTILKNQGRWDKSNVCMDTKGTLIYDKDPEAAKSYSMEYIDYGLSAIRRDEVPKRIQPKNKMDLAEFFRDLSKEGLLAGMEVKQRFYEIGSVSGLEDFRKWATENGFISH